MAREDKMTRKEKKGSAKAAAPKRAALKAGLIKPFLAALFVILFGIIAELCCLFPAARALGGYGRFQSVSLDLSDAAYTGFELAGGELVLTEDVGFLRIPLGGRYTGKFVYSYRYDGLMNAEVKVASRNAFGELREKEMVITRDRNPRILPESRIPVNGFAEYAEITLNRNDLREAGLSQYDFDSMPASVTGLSVTADSGLNPYRLLFFWAAALVFAGLIAFRDFFAGRMERGFLLIALAGGLVMAAVMPSLKCGWDEEVHFAQALWLSDYRVPVPVTDAVMDEFVTDINTWPFNQPGGLEEQRMVNAWLDSNASVYGGPHNWSTDLNHSSFTGYIGEAVFLKAGQLLKLPFSDLFRLGRVGNLIAYVLVMALAIRITPAGKGLMAFLGLMPEAVFLASVYSYDPTVTAFLFLAFALILREALTPGRKMTWRMFFLILLAFFWGCRIKAVYAPLLLAGFLIPADHYRNRREMFLMRAGFLLAVLGLMASFVLPVLIAPAETGDLRGGATSEKGQMAFILGQPFAYAQILLKEMIRTLPSYVLGEDALGTFGHLGKITFPWMLYAGSAACILTGNTSSTGRRLSGKNRIFIFLLTGAAAVLVWTSMYIAFTPPGNGAIEGVQGRYYIPFLYLLWLILSPEKVHLSLKQESQNALALSLSGIILFGSIYFGLILPYCL